jgi:hypothetical protein
MEVTGVLPPTLRPTTWLAEMLWVNLYPGLGKRVGASQPEGASAVWIVAVSVPASLNDS